MLVEIASLAIFVSLFLGVYLFGRIMIVSPDSKSSKLRLFVEPVFGSVTEPLANSIPMRRKYREDLKKDLLASGRFHDTALKNFLSIRNTVLFCSIILAFALICLGLVDGYEYFVGLSASILCILIYSIPRLAIAANARSRRKKIEKSIPDVLDLIALAVASGLPISEALNRVNEQIAKSYPALSQELKIICSQTRTGSVEAAFEKFSDRIQIPEIASWATLMKQTNRLGGGMADALGEYANRIREDRNLRIEKSGNTASIKMLLPVVLCICPPIMIMLIGPALLDVRDFLVREANSPSAAIAEFNAAREQSREASSNLRNNR